MEGGLFFVALLDTDVVVSPANVELCEVLGPTKLVNELRDEREWISILDRHLVQFAVVLDWSQRAILFLNEEEGGGEGRLGRVDTPGF